MAAAFLSHLAEGAIDVRSAGTQPADQVNPVVIEAMKEKGIDLLGQVPKVLTDKAVEESDVVITMGCGDTCPYFPGKRYLDWKLDDPAGANIEAIRPIRDQIEKLVRVLIKEIAPA
jgi:protein-tyrosine-phosphatase